MRSLLQRLRARFQQWRCDHAVYYDRDMKPRDANGIVRCPCYKCGKMLAADCGLHLGAKLHRFDDTI